MIEKLKNPNCLIDAEALASHVSIITTKSGADTKPVNKSGSNSSKNGSTSKMKNSQSALQESTNKSATSDKLSGTSMSQT